MIHNLPGGLRNEDFITSRLCRVGKMPTLRQPGRLSHIIELPFLRASVQYWQKPGFDSWVPQGKRKKNVAMRC
jgi:hypothetical protein